jgi:hypothetical protein
MCDNTFSPVYKVGEEPGHYLTKGKHSPPPTPRHISIDRTHRSILLFPFLTCYLASTFHYYVIEPVTCTNETRG